MSHFKGLAIEVQKQVCAMQALVLYSRYYQPLSKTIDYSNIAIYGGLDFVFAKYTPGGTGSIGDILNLIKPLYKFGLVNNSNLSALKQNMLWLFARQLDANKDYTSDASSQATLSTGVTSFNLQLFATDTTQLVSSGATTNLGIGVLSLSYIATGLIFDFT
jgi:hypothetical protein